MCFMKKLFAAVVVLAVLAAGGYAGYWYYLAMRVEPAMAGWPDSRRNRRELASLTAWVPD